MEAHPYELLLPKLTAMFKVLDVHRIGAVAVKKACEWFITAAGAVGIPPHEVIVNEFIVQYAERYWYGEPLETKMITQHEWLLCFERALSGGIEGFSVDPARTARVLDYLINEGSLNIALDDLSL